MTPPLSVTASDLSRHHKSSIPNWRSRRWQPDGRRPARDGRRGPATAVEVPRRPSAKSRRPSADLSTDPSTVFQNPSTTFAFSSTTFEPPRASVVGCVSCFTDASTVPVESSDGLRLIGSRH